MFRKAVVVVLVGATLLSGCSFLAPNRKLGRTRDGRLVYNSTGTEGVDYTFEQSQKLVNEVFDARNLAANARECGRTGDEAYFQGLINKFLQSKIYVYKFTYKGRSQEPSTFTITLVPNILGFESLVQLKENFDFCGAGGGMYPVAISDKWYMFKSSCGAGFDDGSGLPLGCTEIESILDAELQFE